MIPLETITIKASDGLDLSAAIFRASAPSALVHIIHGAQEHKGRYYELAHHLTTHGISVILSDLRGHGASISEDVPQGFMNSLAQLLEDLKQVTDTLKSQYPETPLILYGHSLGSLFARCYLQDHDQDIEKLILTGTVDYRFYVKAGVLLTKWITQISGPYGKSALLDHLLGINGSDDSWVSVNEANRKARRSDPHFFTSYRNAASLTIGTANLQQRAFDKFKCQNPDLQILSLTGQEDPITGGPRGLNASIKALEKAGYRYVESRIFPGMRHEVIHETERAMVFKAMLEFIDPSAASEAHAL